MSATNKDVDVVNRESVDGLILETSEAALVNAANEGDGTKPPWSGRTSTIVTVSLLGVTLGAFAMMFIPGVPRETKGMLALLIMMTTLLMRIPVGVSLGLSGLAGIFAISGYGALANAAGSIPFAATANWSLSVLPPFVFMGLLLWRSGITRYVYEAAKIWLGWVPGGLAVTTNVAGIGLATVSGSSLGITYALARLGIPEMLRAGYHRRLATGSTLVSAFAGQLIPPAISLVVYAGIANTSVGQQLISGIIPGVLLCLAFVTTIILVSIFKPHWAPKPPALVMPMSQKLLATVKIVPIFALAATLLIGIYTGFFTASEAASFGALGAVVITVVVAKRDSIKVIARGLLDTATTCAAIFLMVASATFLNRMLATSGLTLQFSNFVNGLGLDRVVLLLLLTVIFLILGIFLEGLTIMLLAVPILIPILENADVSLLWFGVFTIVMSELAIVSPPVGVLTFIVHKIAQNPEVNLGQKISLSDVFKGGMMFVPLAIVLVIVLIFFPEIVSFLPELSNAK